MNNDKDLHDPERHDPDLHDQNISALYHQLPDEAPSPDTDARIRAAARRAVGPAVSATPGKPIFTLRRQGLLATAATLVLGVALLAQWQREPQKLQEMVAAAPEPVTGKPAAAGSLTQEHSIVADAPAPAPMVAQAKQKTIVTRRAIRQPESAADADAVRADIAAAPAPAALQDRLEETDSGEHEAAGKAALADSRAAAIAATAQARQHRAAREREQDAADMMKKLAPATASVREGLPAKNEITAATAARTTLLPYQQAMQDGNWLQAESALAAAQNNESSQQRMDRQLVASLQKKSSGFACSQLPAGETLLCQFIVLHDQGVALPADALTRLEKSGAISDGLSYRRPAVMKLLEKR